MVKVPVVNLNNPETIKQQRQDALINAIINGEYDFLESFLNATVKYDGFNINSPIGYSWQPLLHACNYYNYEIIDLLIRNGADVNIHDEGTTPLMVSCMHGKEPDKVVEIVKLLLREGAVINVSDRLGRTPLMFAAMNGFVDVVKIFLQSASLEACDNEGNTVSTQLLKC